MVTGLPNSMATASRNVAHRHFPVLMYVAHGHY